MGMLKRFPRKRVAARILGQHGGAARHMQKHPNAALHAEIAGARAQITRGAQLLWKGKKLATASAALAAMGGEIAAGIGLGVGAKNIVRGHLEINEGNQRQAAAEKEIVRRRLGISDSQRIRRRLGLDQQTNTRNRRKMRRA